MPSTREAQTNPGGCENSLVWVERWLSADRFAPYLAACDGDVDQALELYKWNASLGQVLMRDISFFEVALRNSYNNVMESYWPGERHWLLDDESPVRRQVPRRSSSGVQDANRVNRKIIDKAVAGLRGDLTAGRLVPSLTLGFWIHLTDRSREAVIWRTSLYRAWPKGTNRAELQTRLDGILRTRNRAAHAERLFNSALPQYSPRKVDADAIELLKALCSEAHGYLFGAGESSVERFLVECPPPADVAV